MNPTDTPLTDAATELYGDRPFMVPAVPVEFAKALERELAASKAEVEELASKYFDMESACSDHMGIVKAQQDELEAISFALGTNEGHSSVDHIVRLRAELAELWSRFDKQMEAEAEVDRLRDAFSHLTDEITQHMRMFSKQNLSENN